MNKYIDLLSWCEYVEEEEGDPAAACCQMFFQWDKNCGPHDVEKLVCGMHKGEVTLVLGPDHLLPIKLSTDGMVIEEGIGLTVFGANKIAPGLWELSPSLNLPGTLHGFVVLYDVPEPAPWERLVILAPADALRAGAL